MSEPNGWQKFLYYTLGLTPPVAAREWVERDLNTSAWRIRRALRYWIGTFVGLCLIALVLGGISARPWGVPIKACLIGAAIGGFLGGLLQATVLADYVRRRHVIYYTKKWGRSPVGR